MNTEVKLNFKGLIELSNAANKALAEPMAEAIAERLGDGYTVVRHDRETNSGWARTRVITTTAKAMRHEARHGELSRSLS